MRLRDVIGPTLGVRYDESCALTLERMKSFGIRHVIVTRDNAIAGVVSITDLERGCSANADAPVGELATEVPVLDGDAPIQDAANLMRDHKVGCVPVVEDSAIAGVVTIEKLLELIGEGTIQAARRRR